MVGAQSQTDVVAAKSSVARRRTALVIMSAALLMHSFEQTMIATALPTLSKDLGTSVNWSAWTISIYALGMILSMPIGGRISDQMGRKKVFLTALAVFTTSSLCCALSTDIRMLIVFRATEALGAGVMVPSASGIVADEFPENRDRLIGFISSLFPIGAMAGPAIGAFIIAHWSWRTAFLVNVPTGIVLLLLGIKFFSPSAHRGPASIDIRGIALLAASLLALLYGVGRLGDGGGGLVPALISIAGGAVLVALFLRHARVFPRPVIPIALLTGRTFGIMGGLNFVFGAACLGTSTLMPLYAQQRYGLDIVSSGTLLTARSVGIFLLSALTVLALRRTGYRIPMVAGFMIAALALLMQALPPPHQISPYLWLAVASGLLGIGMGVFVPPANNATLHKAPSQIAAIAGLRGMFRQVGLLIGVASISAIVAVSNEPGVAQAWAFGAMALVVVSSLPVILLVPDHRGKW